MYYLHPSGRCTPLEGAMGATEAIREDSDPHIDVGPHGRVPSILTFAGPDVDAGDFGHEHLG